jgi:hypothetical protein
VDAKLEIDNVTQSVTVNEDVNFFNDAAGVPLPAQWNYTYALALGGRVWIPKLYDGKNKTFFWIAREGYDDTKPIHRRATRQQHWSGWATSLKRVLNLVAC